MAVLSDEAANRRTGLNRVILAVVSIFVTTGWTFGWPPIRIMLEHAKVFEGAHDEGQLYEALFSFAAAGVDFGGHVAGWMFGIGGPRFCVAVGGTGCVISMLFSFLATRYVATFNWLLFPALTIQAVAGAHFFVGVLNFQHAIPQYGNFIIGAFIYASCAGGSVSEWQRQLLETMGVLTPEGVQMMFLVQGCVYVAITLGVAALYPKEAYTSGRLNEEDHGKCCSLEAWYGIVTSLGFWGLTLLTCTVGVHAKWVLSELDSILEDRDVSKADAQAMTAVFFTWMPLKLLAAYLMASFAQNFFKGNLNIMLILACIASMGQALVNTYGNFQAQVATFVFMPTLWQILYMTATQYSGVLFPRPTDQAHAWGLLIGVQGIAMFTLNGLHAFAMAHGHATTNLMFAVFAGVAIVVIGVVDWKQRSSGRAFKPRTAEPTANRSFAENVENSWCRQRSSDSRQPSSVEM